MMNSYDKTEKHDFIAVVLFFNVISVYLVTIIILLTMLFKYFILRLLLTEDVTCTMMKYLTYSRNKMTNPHQFTLPFLRLISRRELTKG